MQWLCHWIMFFSLSSLCFLLHQVKGFTCTIAELPQLLLLLQILETTLELACFFQYLQLL